VFIDPNTLSVDGTIAIADWEASPNGETLVYLESDSGSDWRTAKFKSIVTGDALPDTLTNIKFTMLAWTKDSLGVIYSAYAAATSTSGTNRERNDFQELFYHHLGTNQTEDILLVSYPENPDYSTPGEISSCGNFLIISPQVSCGNNLVYILDLGKWIEGGRRPKPELSPIIETWEAEYKYVTSNAPYHFFRTNKDAPNFRVITIDMNNPAESSRSVILPQKKRKVLEWCAVVQDFLVASYLSRVQSTLKIHKLEDGSLVQKIPFKFGNFTSWSGRRYEEDFFFRYESFETPGVVYRIKFKDSPDPGNGIGSPDRFDRLVEEMVEEKAEKSKKSCCGCCSCCCRPPPVEAIGPFNVSIFYESIFLDCTPPSFIATQVWFKSWDGTKVPMFIVHSAELKLKCRPCLVTGYGAHGYILKPYFDPFHTVFLIHMGGILAVVNARGGGEFGERWHAAGRQHQKQNTFDDFQAASEYLIKEKYTTKEKLVISGTSSGGMSCAVCVNQRPDLYAGAILIAGAMDMLRFHKFTIGYNWIPDYGSPDKESDAKNLLRFSPLHNVAVPAEKGVQYPAVLVMTGEEDDRVVPCHSYKYVAELQATVGMDQRHLQTKPLLLRVEPKTGHGFMKPISKLIQEDTDKLTFISYAVGLSVN